MWHRDTYFANDFIVFQDTPCYVHTIVVPIRLGFVLVDVCVDSSHSASVSQGYDGLCGGKGSHIEQIEKVHAQRVGAMIELE